MTGDLELYLRQFHRRIRLQDLLWRLQSTLWMPAALGILAQIIGRLVPIPQLSLWTVAPFILWAVLVGLSGILIPQSRMSVAQRVDLELGLKERLSTALAFESDDLQPAQLSSLAQSDGTAAEPASESAGDLLRQFLTRQRADAIRVASKIHPQQDLPLPWLWKRTAVGLALTAIGLLLIPLYNPMNLRLQERAAIKEEAAAQAEKIEAFKEDVAKSTELSPEEKEKLIKRLEELAQSLRQNPGDLEQAIADLSRFEEALRRDMDANLVSNEALLQALSRRLADLAGSAGEANAEGSASKNLEELSQKIGELTPEERDQLARNLAQMAAQSFQVGNQALGDALSELAQAVQAGDQEAAKQAANSAQASLQQLEQQISNQKALQAAAAQAQASRQALSQKSKSTAQTQGQPGGQNPGASPNSGSQPSSGGGTRANQLPPGKGGRTNVRPQGSDVNAPLGELGKQVYSPWERAGATENKLFIPGQDSGEGETTSVEGQSPQAGIGNPALVPYNQVFFQYLTAANQAMQKDYIPVDLQDFVRDYFASLEPGN